jgi:diguanylate cyclase (GGDEF)-like protein
MSVRNQHHAADGQRMQPEHFSILLVDDDVTVIRILGRILADFAPLRFVTSGRSALKLARESLPDLVLMDIEMPEVGGFEACKAFKADPALAAVPIIFLTGHESPQLQARGIELGAADFISKPPHAPLVLARVRTYQRLKSLSDTLSTTLRSAVTMDFLTGSMSRREWEKSLTKEWLRAQRSASSLVLLLADIDGFTDYNATAGEEQGDACLKSVADVLRSAAHRPTDLLARYSGGKFALLLPETDAQGAGAVARRAIDMVDALQIRHPALPVGPLISLSVGAGCRISSRSAPANETASMVPDDLMAAAEQALQSAKSAGGHQWKVIDMANRRPHP